MLVQVADGGLCAPLVLSTRTLGCLRVSELAQLCLVVALGFCLFKGCPYSVCWLSVWRPRLLGALIDPESVFPGNLTELSRGHAFGTVVFASPSLRVGWDVVEGKKTRRYSAGNLAGSPDFAAARSSNGIYLHTATAPFLGVESSCCVVYFSLRIFTGRSTAEVGIGVAPAIMLPTKL